MNGRRVAAGACALVVVVAAAGFWGVAAAKVGGAILAAQAPGAPDMVRLGRTLADGSTRADPMAMDDYIASVLAGEGQPLGGDAAQQALAVTARTFALANRNRHRREGFDLCDTTHCQVVRPPTAVTRRAALATSGRVLLYQGQPAFVFYSAWCGGRSELASEVWAGAIDYSYEPSIEDDACRDEPGWTTDIRASDIERALRLGGLSGARLRNVHIVSRNVSARVARVRVEGFTPPDMTGHEFRMAIGRVVGWRALKSTSFDVERTATGYRFRGRGYGHGVGLCVVGAGHRAARGATADDILGFYFPGLTIGPLSRSTLTSSVGPAAQTAPDASGTRGTGGTRGTAPVAPAAPGAPVAPATLAPTAPDIDLVLPASEEGERAVVLSLVRAARGEIAKATAQALPPRLQVTVHPTVESFGRATGQPWWVQGATEGTAIAVWPLTMLRQQGQLERTLRHEVAHAMLDGALSQKPMWVREGAAAFFAGPAPVRPSKSARVSCPTDIELLRPVSAGAQRDAYARAETCFARRIADGKLWDQVQ